MAMVARTHAEVGAGQHTPHHAVEARETLRIADLTLWRRKIRGVEFAVRSADTARPNPLVLDSLLIVSIWSPGAICAVARDDGKPIWRRPMPPLGPDSVAAADGVLYAHTPHTLHALDAATGQTRWTWSPTREAGEHLLASPTVASGKVFIGDQAGRFWCLDAQSGQAIWSQEPSPEHALPIAATAVVIRNLVIIATRDAVAVAYEVETGREVWRRVLDGPVGSELCNFKGQVALRTFWSAYVLGARDGEVAVRWHWRGRYTRHLSCTNDALLVVTQKAHGDMATRPSSVLLASVATGEGPLLIGLDRDGERFRTPCPRSLVGLRWSAETGLVYESRLDGLGILHPRTGERLHELTSPNERDGAHGGLVDVRDDVVYMLDVRGVLRALQHPARLRVRRAG